MQPRSSLPGSSRRWLMPITGLALLACAITAHAATGARAVLQGWDPLNPKAVRNSTLFDHPTLVSDSLQDGWTQARPKICEQLRLKMGLGGAAGGQTLRDITCLLDEQVVLEVTPAGQNALRARFAVSGYVEATSTTPTPVGAYGDPRFSIALTAKLDLILAVQPSREQTLRVSKAQFTLDNATLDSQGFNGDLLLFVVDDMVPFFGGPNYKNMAENAINAVSVEFAGDFNAALAPVNEKLMGPSTDVVRVGASARNNYISVAFAPREIAPPTNGRVTGQVRWDPAKFTPRNGCQSFSVRSRVQIGPAPLFAQDPNPPTRDIGVFQAEQVGVSSCAFTLTGIAEGWPNFLISQVLDPPIIKNPGSSNDRETYRLTKDGWQDPFVIPQPVMDGRNYLVAADRLKMSEQAQIEKLDRTYLEGEYRTNPKFDPGRAKAQRVEIPDYGIGNPSRVSERITPRVDAVRLNPQALPPEPDPDPMLQTQAQAVQAQAVEKPTGTEAGIIIVGGKPSYRRIDRATSTTPVDEKVVTSKP